MSQCVSPIHLLFTYVYSLCYETRNLLFTSLQDRQRDRQAGEQKVITIWLLYQWRWSVICYILYLWNMLPSQYGGPSVSESWLLPTLHGGSSVQVLIQGNKPLETHLYQKSYKTYSHEYRQTQTQANTIRKDHWTPLQYNTPEQYICCCSTHSM